jgi:hypothetical protein
MGDPLNKTPIAIAVALVIASAVEAHRAAPAPGHEAIPMPLPAMFHIDIEPSEPPLAALGDPASRAPTRIPAHAARHLGPLEG